MQSRCCRKSPTDGNIDLISQPTANAMVNGDAAPALAPSPQSDGRFIDPIGVVSPCRLD